MKTVVLVYIAFAAMWIAFFVTQIVIPVLQGTKIFPLLRSKELQAAEADLVEAREESHLRLLEEHIARIRGSKMNGEPPVPPIAEAQRGVNDPPRSYQPKTKKRGL